MKKTSDFIDSLSSELSPVSPARPIHWRIAIGLAFSLLIAVIGVFTWHHFIGEFHQPSGRNAWEFVILTISALLSAGLALKLSSPHFALPRLPKLALGGPALWIILISAAFAIEWNASKAEALTSLHQLAWPCAAIILSVAIPIIISLAAYTSRGAVLYKNINTTLMALAGASFGAAALATICPAFDPLHICLWHAAPVILIALFGSLWGKLQSSSRHPHRE